jgi:hypothetical protein
MGWLWTKMHDFMGSALTSPLSRSGFSVILEFYGLRIFEPTTSQSGSAKINAARTSWYVHWRDLALTSQM